MQHALSLEAALLGGQGSINTAAGPGRGRGMERVCGMGAWNGGGLANLVRNAAFYTPAQHRNQSLSEL